MIILPAIDIKNGKCVRLYKGEFSTAHQVAEDYLETARSFQDAGAKWIHMVDLDGAKQGRPVNAGIFIDVAKNTALQVELGGGIRDMGTIESYLSAGIARVVLGSAALRNQGLVSSALKEYGGDRIAVGIDARDGMAAAEGWLNTSDVNYLELAEIMERIGVKYIIFTEISRDGTLEGPDIEKLGAINKAVSANIIASGGIRDAGDIKRLNEMGVYGAICGKSIYAGSLELREAIKVGGEQ